jgi:hypothetical protein
MYPEDKLTSVEFHRSLGFAFDPRGLAFDGSKSLVQLSLKVSRNPHWNQPTEVEFNNG